MRNMRKYADLYGSALPLQMTIERNALANMNREGPMKSNNFGKFFNNISRIKYSYWSL
jgi:hypothetical protein